MLYTSVVVGRGSQPSLRLVCCWYGFVFAVFSLIQFVLRVAAFSGYKWRPSRLLHLYDTREWQKKAFHNLIHVAFTTSSSSALNSFLVCFSSVFSTLLCPTHPVLLAPFPACCLLLYPFIATSPFLSTISTPSNIVLWPPCLS